MDFTLNVETDPAGAVATISCLQVALETTLLAISGLDQTKTLEWLTQLEAEVMRHVKNLAGEGADEIEETRAMLVGHAAVHATFTRVRERLDANNRSGPA